MTKKLFKSIIRFFTKTKFRKTLSFILSFLIVLLSVKYVFLSPSEVSAADVFIKFDEGYGTSNAVNDANGNVSAGSITGAVWKTSDLCFNEKCLYFDGSGDLVSFGDDDDIDFTSAEDFTIEGWVRHGVISTNADYIVTKHESGTAGGYKVYMDSDGDIVFGVDDDGTWDTTDVIGDDQSKNYDDNRWHHFAAVKDDTTGIYLYVDGILIDSDESLDETGNLTNAANMYIGVDADGSSNSWDGFIDEIKIFGSARTAAEIKADFLQHSPERGITASFGPNDSWISDGLVGYWKMDETSGNATDSSGNSLTLTNNNMTTYTTGKYGNGSEYVPASNQYFSTATTVNGIKTISFWTNPNNNTNYYLSLTSSAYITSSSGTLSTTGFTDYKIFVNGLETTTISADTWQLVTVTTNTAINADQIYIGRQDTNYYDGTLDEIRFFNRTLSPTEVTNLYKWAPGPILKWKLDENTGTTTVYDTSENSNNGSMTNLEAEDWTTGKFGSSLTFDGSNEALTIATASDEDLDFTGSETFSASAWVKITTMPGSGNQDAIITKWDETSTTRGYRLFVENDDADSTGNFQVEVYDESEDQTILATGVNDTVSQNTWYHVGFSFNGGTTGAAGDLKMYTNGVLTNSNAVNNSFLGLEDIATDFTVGDYDTNDSESNNTAFTGIIDNILVYNYIRTQEQIIQDMNGDHPAPGSPVGSPVGYWKLDEGYGTTANDDTDNNNDLTLSNASWTNSGRFGKAWDGDGIEYLFDNSGDNDDFDFAAIDTMTISGWFKHSAISTNPDYILTKSEDGTNGGYQVYMASDGDIVFEVDDDSSWEPDDRVTSTAATYDDGTWHHFVAVKDGTTDMYLYIDGVLIDSEGTVDATATLANDDTLYVGIDDDGSSNLFDGELDELAIFRSALNANQVKSLYNRGQAAVMGALSTDSSGNPNNSSERSYCPPGDSTATCGPVLEWLLDENTGTSSISDTSSNDYTGTMNNFSESNWKVGKFNSGLDFNGSSNYVYYADDVPTDLPFTVSAWIKTTQSDSNGTIVTVSDADSTTANPIYYKFYVVGSVGKARVAFDDNGAGAGNFTSDSVINDGQWHHVLAIFNSEDSRIYIDGLFESQSTTSYTYNSEVDRTSIGATIINPIDTYFDGIIDHVRVYDYALNEEQVAWDYNQGAPTAWWKLDESTWTNDCSTTDVYDSSGFDNNGTSCGDQSTSVTGKRNNAIDFDGSGDYIEIADNIRFEFAKDSDLPFSISAWVNMDDATTFPIVSKGDESDNGGNYMLYFDSSDKLALVLYDDSVPTHAIKQTRTSTSAYTSLENNWIHIVATYDGSGGTSAADGIKLYINSKEVASSSSSAGTYDIMGNFNCPVWIGRSVQCTSGCPNDYADGTIDEVKLFRYELTVQQIKAEYNSGVVNYGY